MYSRTTMVGRLVEDPVMRHTKDGTPVCGLRIAVERDYHAKGEKPKTDFMSCTAWRTTAEFVHRYFVKGRLILVEGRIEDVDFVDKSGIKRYDKELKVSDAWFGDSKKSDGADNEAQSGPTGQPYTSEGTSEDQFEEPF